MDYMSDAAIYSMVVGVRYFSVAQKWFRLSHMIALGVLFAQDLHPDPEQDDEAFDIWPDPWVSAVECWFRLWRRLWLRFDPLPFDFGMYFYPALTTDVSLRWEF